MRELLLGVDNPSAFCCHGTADKEIYVEPFARILASKGINPWVDGWEILGGDSILPKIEHGITQADFFLPFISRRSIGRPWVQAEIEMAVTRKMLNKIKIIPILVGVSVADLPLFLQTIHGITISGEEDVSRAAQEAVDSIYGISAKPAVAPRPAYASLPSVAGLSPADVAFLKALCEAAIAEDHTIFGFEDIAARLQESGLVESTMRDAADILNEQRYIACRATNVDRHRTIELVPRGFELYARYFIRDYAQIYDRVAAVVAGAPDVNPGVDAESIAKQMKLPHRLVNHIYEHLASQGKITLSRSLRPSRMTDFVSPSFRRQMRER